VQCANTCVANLFPVLAASPATNGASYANDLFVKICPEIALTIHRVQSGWVAAPEQAPGDVKARRLRSSGITSAMIASHAAGQSTRTPSANASKPAAQHGLVRYMPS
jgi:DNA-binding transcriptional regulator YdaS (Cro superfamily)